MSVNVVSPSTGALSPIATRGQFIQYSVMPTPSVDILNKIVQYIGTTTANYTNGYFYKCIYDETVSPAIYRWDNVSVQAGGGSSAEIIKGYFNPSDNLFYEESTYVTPITGDVNSLYLSLDTNLLYRYNGTIFVEVSNYEIGDGLNLDDNTLSADTVIFTGTSTEWNAVVDKSKYDIVNLTDEATGEVVNVVEDGNLNPVTSNAVYDSIANNLIYDLFSANISSATITFNIPNAYRGIMIICDSGTAYQGLYIVATESSGRLRVSEAFKATAATLDTDVANELTITFSNIVGASICFIDFYKNKRVTKKN